ncbi:MAG: DUF2959 domain-containing protein [Phycisphaerales bacterium]
MRHLRACTCSAARVIMLAACTSGVACTLAACASTSIAVKEALGYPKREQLVARVTEVRDAQGEAKQQFESALAEFLAVTGAKPGEQLEAKYDKLRREFQRSESKAKAVSARIASVESVSGALFAEWRTELAQYKSENLRRASERQLEDTRTRYDQLLAAMKNAESKMGPVLEAFHDQVLFLKHNLNARAIASLQETTGQIQSDVGALVREMEASIAEANAFIDQMRSEPPA